MYCIAQTFHFHGISCSEYHDENEREYFFMLICRFKLLNVGLSSIIIWQSQRRKAFLQSNVVCCIASVQIQIEIEKGWYTDMAQNNGR